MVLLLMASGTFSGSETAFFNISTRKAREFKNSKHRLENLAGQILLEQKKLLTSLLLANMTVNVLYFALSSALLIQINNQTSAYWAALWAAIFFFILLLFGEMLPKALAFKNSDRICIIAALPCYFCIKILHPIQHAFTFLIIEPLIRLLGISKKSADSISISELKSLLDSIDTAGDISNKENQIMTRILELNFLKARHILQPRVDMELCNITSSIKEAREILRQAHLRILPVYEHKIDNIKGIIDLRDILLNPAAKLKELIKPVHFVPEQKNIESLLEFFCKNNLSMALAVDEYGGISGRIDLEQITDRIFSVPHDEQQQAIEKIGPMEYRLSGDLPLSDWAEVFGITHQQTELTTIAGLVMAISDRIPAQGDSVSIKNLKLTAERIHNNRIESVILSLIPMEAGEDK